MPLAAPDHGALKADLDIHGWLERDLLHVYPGFVGVGMTLEATDEKVVAEWPGNSRQAGNAKGFDAIDAEGIDVLGVVAPREGAALGRPQPCVGFAKGNLVAPEVIGEISLDDAEYVSRGNRALGNDRLVQTVRRFIYPRQRLCDGDGVAHGRGGVLVFTPEVEREAVRLGAGAKAGDEVKARFIGPAIVVDDGESYMVAVAQGKTSDT